MLYGAGSLCFISTELATNGSLRASDLLYPAYLSEFSLTAESQKLQAKALIAGKKQIVASAIGEEVYTLKVKSEFIAWEGLQFGYDELARTSTNITLPQLKTARVPLTAPYEINDTAIITSNLASVKAYVANRGTWGNRIFLKRGTTATTKNDVVVSAGKLTFNAALAGAQVQYVLDKTYASVETIGLENGSDQIGKLMFIGLAYGTEFPGKMLIVVPEISRVSTPSLTIAGEVSSLEIDFLASVPAGYPRPFQLLDLSTAT